MRPDRDVEKRGAETWLKRFLRFGVRAGQGWAEGAAIARRKAEQDAVAAAGEATTGDQQGGGRAA